MRERSKALPVQLSPNQRACVERSIAETCVAIGWSLIAVNARSNHVHAVVAGSAAPERMLESLKRWATRTLRATALLPANVRPWSRHGSTVYLWTEHDVEAAHDYVVYGQDKS